MRLALALLDIFRHKCPICRKNGLRFRAGPERGTRQIPPSPRPRVLPEDEETLEKMGFSFYDCRRCNGRFRGLAPDFWPCPDEVWTRRVGPLDLPRVQLK